MVDKLTPKTKRIIKAKIQGKKHKEIAALEYPNATSQSGVELVSRHLRNNAQYLEQSKLLALKEHNITWSRIIKPISEGLEAEKQNNFTGEITPDITTRLRASKQAQELLQAKDKPEELTESLTSLPPNLDEIEYLKLIRRK